MEQSINIDLDDASLQADIVIPKDAIGLVLFVHGSGSSRLSSRNRYVAKILQSAKIGTILTDLLTVPEDQDPYKRFDIPFLGKRVEKILKWIRAEPQLKKYPLGLYGASTGSAAAIIASSHHHDLIKCLVSRGGRPDLAMEYLDKVVCPLLFIVGERDGEVLELNQAAFEHIRSKKKFEIIEGATHLFEEEGCLEKVAQLSATFFSQNL